MRRTALTILATVVGLALLLQFKTHPSGSTTGALASLGSVPTKSPSPRHIRSTPAAPAKHPSRPRTVTATGQTVNTQYGPVQVRIVDTSGRLTDVTAIQLPSSSAHSAEIAAHAAPILRSEALKANSARIDVVSGATYTSDGYAQSLQSALDHA